MYKFTQKLHATKVLNEPNKKRIFYIHHDTKGRGQRTKTHRVCYWFCSAKHVLIFMRDAPSHKYRASDILCYFTYTYSIKNLKFYTFLVKVCSSQSAKRYSSWNQFILIRWNCEHIWYAKQKMLETTLCGSYCTRRPWLQKYYELQEYKHI